MSACMPIGPRFKVRCSINITTIAGHEFIWCNEIRYATCVTAAGDYRCMVSPERPSAECQKNKNGGLDQYGFEHFVV